MCGVRACMRDLVEDIGGLIKAAYAHMEFSTCEHLYCARGFDILIAQVDIL